MKDGLLFLGKIIGLKAGLNVRRGMSGERAQPGDPFHVQYYDR